MHGPIADNAMVKAIFTPATKRTDHGSLTCKDCHGTGIIHEHDSEGVVHPKENCSSCEGRGYNVILLNQPWILNNKEIFQLYSPSAWGFGRTLTCLSMLERTLRRLKQPEWSKNIEEFIDR